MAASRTIAELIEASITLEHAGDMAAALQRGNAALEQSQANGSPEEAAASWVRIGQVHYRLGHYDKARDCAEHATASANSESRARADALVLLGTCAMEVGSLEDAESFYLAASDLARQIGYDLTRYRALHDLATCVYSLRGQFDLALAADQEAYQIACSRNLPDQALTLIAMAGIYLQTGQVELARASLSKITEAMSRDPLYRGYDHTLRAEIARVEEDHGAASVLYAQARSDAEVIGDPALHVFIRLGESRMHQALGNSSAALHWADDAVSWARRAGNQRMLGRALIERACSEWLNGDPETAEADLQAAAAELVRRHQLYDLARAHLLLAALLFEQQRTEAGAAWLSAANEIISGGYFHLLEQERRRAYRLIAAYLTSDDPALQQASSRCIDCVQRVPPRPLRIVMLGGFDAWQGTRPVDKRALLKRRGGELLALLLLSPSRSLAFDQIAEALWGDQNPSAVQTRFHHATSSLRRALEPDLPDKFPSRYLTVDEGRVSLCLPPGSTIDIEAFEDHCRRAEWEKAVTSYTGDLLPEYAYSDWCMTPCERLSELYERALLYAAAERLSRGEFDAALDASRRLLARAPWNEQGTLIYMRASLAMDDRSGALYAYYALEKVLQDEFATCPSADLKAIKTETESRGTG